MNKEQLCDQCWLMSRTVRTVTKIKGGVEGERIDLCGTCRKDKRTKEYKEFLYGKWELEVNPHG